MSEYQSYPLDEVLDFREGPGVLAVDFHDSGVPLLRLAGLKSGASLLDGCNYLDPEKVTKKWAHFQVEQGDTLLSTSASLGEVAVVGAEGVGAVPYTGIIRFRPKDDQVVPAFIPFALRSRAFKEQIEAMGVGSVMKHFGPSHLRQMSFLVPPVATQRAIAEVLGALDDKIAANTAMAATAEGLLAALFTATGIDAEPEQQGLQLTELVNLNPRLPAPVEDEPVYLDMQKLPTSGMGIRDWGHRVPKGGARFQNGDTLLARITPCLENGKTGFVDFLEPQQVGLGSTEYIVMRANQPNHPALSYFLAKSGRFRDFAIRHMVGTSGRQRLAARDLAEYELSAPDSGSLQRFNDTAALLVPRIGAAVREERHLAGVRDALLPGLMSGKIRVKDAERVVEKVT